MRSNAWCRVAIAAVAALAACSSGDSGDPPVVSGPGDAQNHFPLEAGNQWRSAVSSATDGGAPSVVRAQVLASAKGSVLETAVTQGMWMVARATYAKNARGVLLLEGNAGDHLTQQLVPYYALVFPLEPGQTFTQFDRDGLVWDQDLDADGHLETASARGTGVVKAVEDVTVPAGRFAGCALVETTVVVNVTTSATAASVSFTTVEDAWYAPGVGPVKRRVVFPGVLEREEVLLGYHVGGARRGVVDQWRLTSSLGIGDGDLTRPGRPAVGFHGGEYIVVTDFLPPSPWATTTWSLDASGHPSSVVYWGEEGSSPSIAWNGEAWVVAHVANGAVDAHRVTPDGSPWSWPAQLEPAGSPVVLGTGIQPAIGSDGAGALVVWAELVSGQFDVRGALVARDGSTSGAFTVFAAAGEQVLPAVAFDGENYVVAWRDTRSGSGPSTDTQVSAARVSPAGGVLDPQGFAIATGPGIADGPAVASDGSASIVVWADSSTAPYATIRAARIARDGTLLDGPPSGGGVAVAQGASYGAPAVALVGADYLVAWTDASFEPDAGIFTARLSPQGALLDPVPVHAAWPFWDGRAYGSPAIASDGEGALVAFMQSFNDKDIEGAFVYPRADR